ncbi:hypothetical protein [Enterobacter sp. ENT03]|uniref:hypothetical protein n=1 Tax=Enterobacter sp. ENT03 TaxID=2854780 RepID=UPI001C485622|nr:hypothetical protein [Enterobacter sp. ENT03]MBV7404899.1 hypothetical protein [Enterobacter sp. ENT03]
MIRLEDVTLFVRSTHSLRLTLPDQNSDIFSDPVDVAICYGVLDNTSYVALPLSEKTRCVMVCPLII